MDTRATPQFDPITLEILWSRLIAIADKSAKALVRTSFSTIVRESNDYATALMDADGVLLAENTIGIPSFLGIMPRTLKELLKRFPKETWQPGDCIITNDPWLATGHLPDITMLIADFLPQPTGRIQRVHRALARHGRCRMVGGFTGGVRGRHPHPTLSPAARRGTESRRAGLHPRQCPGCPTRCSVTSTRRSRRPTSVAASSATFLDDLGDIDLKALSSILQDRAEGAMRRAIEAVPDGVYRSTVDADGFDDMKTHIECTVTVTGSELAVDYTGTSPQIDRGLNTVMNYTYAYSVYPIKCALDPVTRRNDGSYRPITITAPEGCILNPRRPAPVNARHLTGPSARRRDLQGTRAGDPDQVLAESGGAPSTSIVFGGLDKTMGRYAQIMFASGGMGASAHADGHDCTCFPTNAGAGSIEAFESLAPAGGPGARTMRSTPAAQVNSRRPSARTSRSRSARPKRSNFP